VIIIAPEDPNGHELDQFGWLWNGAISCRWCSDGDLTFRKCTGQTDSYDFYRVMGGEMQKSPSEFTVEAGKRYMQILDGIERAEGGKLPGVWQNPSL
jgi:hypothetical protein